MRIQNPDDYVFVEFIPGKGKKKYEAVLKNKKTGKTRHVGFGERGYQHYHDKIGLYNDLDHNDKKRRANYLKRHATTKDYKFSSSWFSWKYLW